MTDTPTTDLPARIRTDQKKFLDFIAQVMNVPVSAVVRWAIDDARPSLLSKASLQEIDLPKEARRNGLLLTDDEQAAK